MKSCASLLPIVLLTSLSLAKAALADDTTAATEPWRLTTFGTFGFSHASGDDNFRAHRDLTQPENFEGDNSWKLDSLIGAQLTASVTETLSFTVQGVFRERYEQTLERSIERAFLEWRATPNLSFHSGRLRQDFYMLADYRDVGFAYPWVRPPIEFYGAVFLNSVDGLDVVYKHPLGAGVVTVRMLGGQGERDLQTETNGRISTLQIDDALSLSLGYESDRWRIKAGAYRFTFGNDLRSVTTLQSALTNPSVQPVWPNAQHYAELVGMRNKDVGFYSAGASYENVWQVSGEVGYIASDWDALPDAISTYLSVGRHIGEVTPYVLLASIHPTQSTAATTSPYTTPSPIANAQLSALYNGLDATLHLVRFDQHTVSVGARWDVLSNVALKLQWDHSEIAAGGSGLWRNEGIAPSPSATIDLISATVNWVY